MSSKLTNDTVLESVTGTTRSVQV